MKIIKKALPIKKTISSAFFKRIRPGLTKNEAQIKVIQLQRSKQIKDMHAQKNKQYTAVGKSQKKTLQRGEITNFKRKKVLIITLRQSKNNLFCTLATSQLKKNIFRSILRRRFIKKFRNTASLQTKLQKRYLIPIKQKRARRRLKQIPKKRHFARLFLFKEKSNKNSVPLIIKKEA